MRQIKELFTRLSELKPLAKTAIQLGIGLMILFYIVGFSSRISAAYVPNYHNAMALYRGCLEAAPASLFAGVCAGLLGDLMLRSKDDTEKKDE